MCIRDSLLGVIVTYSVILLVATAGIMNYLGEIHRSEMLFVIALEFLLGCAVPAILLLMLHTRTRFSKGLLNSYCALILGAVGWQLFGHIQDQFENLGGFDWRHFSILDGFFFCIGISVPSLILLLSCCSKSLSQYLAAKPAEQDIVRHNM